MFKAQGDWSPAISGEERALTTKPISHISVTKRDFQLWKLVILTDDQTLRLSFQKPWTYKLIPYENMITFEYKFNARET